MDLALLEESIHNTLIGASESEEYTFIVHKHPGEDNWDLKLNINNSEILREPVIYNFLTADEVKRGDIIKNNNGCLIKVAYVDKDGYVHFIAWKQGPCYNSQEEPDYHAYYGHISECVQATVKEKEWFENWLTKNNIQ